jgi:hypothetical protein
VDDAISFFMPGLASVRDYSVKPEAADPERPAIGGKSDKGKRTSDLCLSLALADGGVSRAIFVIEQQHREDASLPLRLFQSFYRASDEYSLPVTSLAIYTGKTEPVDTYYREWQGTSVNFKYNVYSVDETDAEKLKHDDRNFALPVLTAKRMLESGEASSKRGEYSLELLDLIASKGLDAEKAWSFQKFAYRLLRIGKDDIDPKIRGVWKMQFRPIDEVVRDIHIRDAEEYGKIELARKLLTRGISPEIIAESADLSLDEVKSLVN